MIDIRFTKFVPNIDTGNNFANLLNIFIQLLTISSGDVAKTLNWMNQMDKKYNLTNKEYGMGDFIQELKNKMWFFPYSTSCCHSLIRAR